MLYFLVQDTFLRACSAANPRDQVTRISLAFQYLWPLTPVKLGTYLKKECSPGCVLPSFIARQMRCCFCRFLFPLLIRVIKWSGKKRSSCFYLAKQTREGFSAQKVQNGVTACRHWLIGSSASTKRGLQNQRFRQRFFHMEVSVSKISLLVHLS